MKVYCKNCKSYKEITGIECSWFITQCNNKNNIYRDYIGEKHLSKKPKEINKNNNCSWYEPNLFTKIVEWFKNADNK